MGFWLLTTSSSRTVVEVAAQPAARASSTRNGSQRVSRGSSPAGQTSRFIGLDLDALVIVIETDDIVLAQVFAALDLDDHQRDLAGILQAVVLADGDEGRLVDVDHLLLVTAGHQGGAGNDDPVLTAVVVLLQRKPLSRRDLDALDLVAAALVEHQVGPPGAFSSFHADCLLVYRSCALRCR
jgi:hypothetical protein